MSIHDYLLEVGENSLLATRIIPRMIRSFQVEIPVRSLFETPTVAGMGLLHSPATGKRRRRRGCGAILADLEEISEE
jgi:hypothetical protein